jgi:uncharacterized protein YndB with AHSA1/START domain
MTSMTSEQAVVRVNRTIPASPERVYRAWLEPELLRRWMAPGYDVSRVEVDPRVGGHFRIWHASDGEDRGGFESEIVELVPAKRIAFTWGIVGPDRLAGPVYDSRLTVTFEEASGGATELTLVHERLEELFAAMPSLAEQFGPGWELVVGKLAAMLDAAERV